MNNDNLSLVLPVPFSFYDYSPFSKLPFALAKIAGLGAGYWVYTWLSQDRCKLCSVLSGSRGQSVAYASLTSSAIWNTELWFGSIADRQRIWNDDDVDLQFQVSGSLLLCEIMEICETEKVNT